MNSASASSVVVLDFETTGLSPNMGDRAIEIGAVKIENGIVTDTFQSLINPGFRVSGFIQNYTGITNEMLSTAPGCEGVMSDFAEFISGYHLVAHNASFDKRFLDAEMDRYGLDYSGDFTCSMLVARRLIQDAPTHKLGDLVRYKQIENDGTFHRALADAEMTGRLWLTMLQELEQNYSIRADIALMQKISRTSKHAVEQMLLKL